VSRRVRRPAWYPSERNELLLRAALGEGDSAVSAWEEFSEQAGPEYEDVPGLQLMPLAWRNLSEIDPGLQDLDLLRGAYRFVWVKNQVLLDFGARVLENLHGVGIETMVLKGAALSLLYYRDLGVRLMADFDVLVPRRSAPYAIALMRERYQPDPEVPDPAQRIETHHGTPFIDGPDRNVDLHWYSLWQSSPDDDLWRAAVPIEVAGIRSKALCPADQLVHLCAHGAIWQREPILRWIPDAIAVIDSGAALDWDRVVSQARRQALTSTMADALGYLVSTFDVTVPGWALEELRSSRRSVSERIGRHSLTRPTTMLWALGIHWERYRRLKRLDPDAPRPSTFASHLRRWWGYSTYRGLLAYSLRRAFTGRSVRGPPSGQVPTASRR
jgi:Uncharacterised nucleotidyltransferase